MFCGYNLFLNVFSGITNPHQPGGHLHHKQTKCSSSRKHHSSRKKRYNSPAKGGSQAAQKRRASGKLTKLEAKEKRSFLLNNFILLNHF